MKIICTKENLHQSLSLTSRIISSGNSLPVLNNLLLKTDKGRLKISSTNLEMAINTWVGGKIEEEGELTAPARLINEYVNNLTTDKITITSTNQILLLEGKNAKTHINGLSAEEFPLIPKINEKILTKIDGGKLSNAIKEVTFAAAFFETQPEISGILLTFSQNTLTLTGTDRYRLAEAKVEIEEKIDSQIQVIMPARAVTELGRILGIGAVEVFITEGQISFRSGEVELISRLIDGKYPDYQQIIPRSFTTEITIERVEFIQALKAASLFSSDNNNIELEANNQGKKTTIRSQSSQTGDSEIQMDAQILGQKNSIIFNYRYLLECLNNLSDEKILLKLINPGSPAMIVPLGREDYLYLVMPIKT